MSITTAEFTRLQNELSQVKASRYDSETRARKLQGEVERLRQEVAKQDSGIQGLFSRSTWGSAQSPLPNNAQLQALQSQLEDSEMQIQAMRSNLQDQFTTNQSLQKEIDELKAGGVGGEDARKMIADLKAQVGELSNKYKISEEEREAVNAELAAFRSVAGSQGAGVASSTATQSNQEGEEGESKLKEGDTATNDTQELTNKIQALKVEAATWKEKYERKQGAMKEMEERKDREVQDVRDQLSSLRSLYGTVERDLARGKGEMVNLQQELQTEKKNSETEKLALKQRMEADVKNQIKKLKDDQKILKNNLIKATREAEECKATAENRKAMVDELSKEKQKMESSFVEQINELSLKYQKDMEATVEKQNAEICRLDDIIATAKDKLKTKESQMKILKRTLEEVTQKFTLVTNEKTSIQQELSEVMEAMDRLDGLYHELQRQFITDADDNHNEILALVDRLGQLQQENEEANQLLKDARAGQKLAERKGVALVKDLKREVKQNHIKIQKLELELADLKNNSISTMHSPEESKVDAALANRLSMESTMSEDRHSAFLRIESEASLSSSFFSNRFHSTPQYQELEQIRALEEDNAQLIGRVAELQCEESSLQEKVKFLEQKNRLLGQDLMVKSNIIKQYMMDSKAGAVVGRRMEKSSEHEDIGDKIATAFKDIRTGWGYNANEMQKRLQSMLEETLTKNITLMSSLEALGQENDLLRMQIVELSKQMPVSTTV